jgi:hypothetical protein
MAVEDHNGEVVSPQEECPDCSTTTASTRERSFDELAKGLANSKLSRRGMLRMLGGALLGGTLASIPGVAWAAKSGCASGVTCKGKCCPVGATCTKGARGGCTCPTGQTACSGQCVSLTTNQNCGSCGNACSGGKTCQGGACACPQGQTDCGGVCVFAACGGGSTFNPNSCRCECEPGRQYCAVSNTCVRDCEPPDQLTFDPDTCTCHGTCNESTPEGAPCGFDPTTGLACACYQNANGAGSVCMVSSCQNPTGEQCGYCALSCSDCAEGEVCGRLEGGCISGTNIGTVVCGSPCPVA